MMAADAARKVVSWIDQMEQELEEERLPGSLAMVPGGEGGGWKTQRRSQQNGRIPGSHKAAADGDGGPEKESWK